MKRIPLFAQIFAAMFLGAVLGIVLNTSMLGGLVTREEVLTMAAIGEGMGRIFLSLLQMVVVPLVFSSLVASITRQRNLARLGPLGVRSLGWYLCTSAIAIVIGLVLVNTLQPGAGLDYEGLMRVASRELADRDMNVDWVSDVKSGPGVLVEILFRMIPTNVVAAATSNGSILSVICFAVLFGAATVVTGGQAAETVDRGANAVYRVMLTLTDGILKLAPLGIFGYVLFVTASTGVALASALGWYMVTVALALLLHGCVVLPLLLVLLTRRNPIHYAREMREALFTAFSTASSAGTLPLTLKGAKNAGIREEVSAFTLPLGATVNMDGTALYEVVAVLFVAQMMGDLSVADQGVVAVTALLASIGAAGIPHAGTVMMVTVMQAVSLPTEAVLVILSVDRVLDMGRTTVNVWSDAVGAAVVDASLPRTGESG